jgi:hypothetical protein
MNESIYFFIIIATKKLPILVSKSNKRNEVLIILFYIWEEERGAKLGKNYVHIFLSV